MTFSDRLDFDLLRDLFGVGPGESDRAVIRAAANISSQLPQLVISVAAREGMPIGTGSADALRRARARADHYDLLYKEITAEVPARVRKGRSIAACYPPDLVRSSADIDLLVPDEATLWAAALAVCGREDVERIEVALIRHGDRTHVVLGLAWPTEDPLLDRDLRVELSTLALAGDHPRVPPSPDLPADETLADLLCIADERFSREFTVRDVLDTLMVFDHRPPRPDELAKAAAERAPELVELMEKALAVAETTVLAECVAALRAPADAELLRRSPAPADTPRAVVERLARGLPVYGLLLRETRRDWPASRLHEVDGLHLLCTPIADFLMVGSELVAEEDYHAAMRALEVCQP
ncbi:hypothetical protein [Kutzneria sp. NPDC052558]|uniref:hypothetical protein n=1 Tax=Kutzneria sp. NPDC052558 TaxID=3364121 RepID=UPI0037CA097C